MAGLSRSSFGQPAANAAGCKFMPYYTPQPDRDFAGALGRNNQNATSAAELLASERGAGHSLADRPLRAPVLDALV